MSEPLRILMLSHHRRFKAYARSHAMARHLVQRGHAVSLILTANTAKAGIVESDWDGVHVIETPDLLWGRLRSGWDPWNLLNRLVALNKDRGRYDLVHCFETRPATIYPALFYCRRHHLPFLTDWNDWFGRGGIVDELRPGWYRTLFGGVETFYEEAFRARGAGLTVISSALARRAIGLGVARERICHIPGGAFTDTVLPRTREVCRQRVGLPFAGPLLGFSSLDSYLDMTIVIEALSIVAKRHPTVKLILTGNPGKSIVELAKSHGVEDRLHLTGFLSYDDLPWYLGCVDLFLLPFPDKIYNVGRWPNKVCDYMSLGRPTVSNPVGDIKTLFEDHQVGLLAAWDPADFAQKIIDLIENPDLADQLGDNARKVATTIYDWTILTERLEDFYYSILDQERM
jgi:glycosyltransferase involved in cell wall biosynthesis